MSAEQAYRPQGACPCHSNMHVCLHMLTACTELLAIYISLQEEIEGDLSKLGAARKDEL